MELDRALVSSGSSVAFRLGMQLGDLAGESVAMPLAAGGNERDTDLVFIGDLEIGRNVKETGETHRDRSFGADVPRWPILANRTPVATNLMPAGQQEPTVVHHDRSLARTVVCNQHAARIGLLDAEP